MAITIGSFTLSIGAMFIFALILLAVAITAFLRRSKKEESKGFGDIPSPEIKSASALKKKATGKKVVATVRVTGPILTSSIGLPPISRDFVTYADRFESLMDYIAKSEEVSAVIVQFLTPGGSPTGSDRIAEAIKRCNAVKPVYAYIGEMSASGGVWAMVVARKVFSAPGALTGSIGVRGPTILTYEGVSGNHGMFGSGVIAKAINGDTIFAGAGKNLGDPFASPEEGAAARAVFQKTIDGTYDFFVEHVSTARGIAAEKIRNIGAAILNTTQALEIGLIDKVMTIAELEAYVAKELNVSTDACEFVTMASKKTKSGLFGLTTMADVLYMVFPHLVSQRIEFALSHQPQLMMLPNFRF